VTIHVPLRKGGATLTEVLDRDLLASQADWLIFGRGVDYHDRGYVTGFGSTDVAVTATVVGTRPYAVSIELAETGLVFDCSCPMGRDREFCKHLVAVGLEVAGDEDDGVAGDPQEDSGAFAAAAEADDLGPVRAWLEQQPVERLRDLLVEQARRDPEVHLRLTMLAAVEDGGPINPAGYQAAITDALATATFDDYGFVHYDEAGAWRERVEAVLDDLDSLLDAGFAAETVGLAEDVMQKLNDSVGSIDDSDGQLYEVFERAMGLHAAACNEAMPDPVALAERLFDWAYRWELDGFLTAVRHYEPVLGEEGLAAYRRLAEERWRTVPVLGPGDDRSSRFGERFRITSIMETLAETTGELEALLDVMRRDRVSGYAFLRIAEACRRYDRDDLALEWALRGREAFPGELRLAELICELHTEAGRSDEALAVVRATFGRVPTLERYQQLRTLAEAAAAWPAERDPALAAVRSGIEERRRGSAPEYSRHGTDGSVLVEILLWEQDGDAAWEAARSYGCDRKLELHLSAVRGQQHPADALDVYRRHLEAALQPANNRAYDQVAQLLEAIGPLYVALGRVEDFDALVAEIRTTYKRRPNLMSRLDRARL
jgi:uncharacterized Zn finger protein